MLKHIRKVFSPSGTSPNLPQAVDPVQMAIAALLIEAALFDGQFDDREQAQILKLLRARFDLTQDAAIALCEQAKTWAENPNNLHRFTKIVKDSLPNEERVELIEMLWEVAYADGHLDSFEANLLRRIGGLIYVSDRERGAARKRALDRLGIDESKRPE